MIIMEERFLNNDKFLDILNWPRIHDNFLLICFKSFKISLFWVCFWLVYVRFNQKTIKLLIFSIYHLLLDLYGKLNKSHDVINLSVLTLPLTVISKCFIQ